MPVDPEISLHVFGAGGPQANPQPSPFDTIGKFADVQSKLNEVRLFNQTFAARQAAGQIFATSPDMATATDRISKDPMVSAFAPELVNLARQNQLVMTELQGKQQEQARSGFEGFVKALPQIYNHPEQWGPMVNAQLDLLPPALRAQVAPSIEMIRKGLTDGLPEDPHAALDMYHSRLNGMMVAAGITPDLIHQVAGTPGQLNTGGTTIGTMQTPAGEPGGGTLQPAAGGVGMTLPPQLAALPNKEGGTTTAVVNGGGTNVTPIAASPTIPEGATLKADATATEANTTAAQHVAEIAPVRLRALDTIVDTMRKFQAGGGAPTRAAVAQLAQALENAGVPGIDDKLVNKIGNSSLSAFQLFDTQLKPLLTSMLTQDAAGQGRVMLPEVEAYIHLFDTSKDPRAIIGALNNIRFAYQMGVDRADKWQDYQKSGKPASGFYLDYLKNFDPKKLPKSVGGYSLEPTNPATVLGGAPGKPSLDDLLKKYGKKK